MEDTMIFWVASKGDDYGACKSGFVETTQKNACQYYHHKKIELDDWKIFSKYFEIETYEEEDEKTAEERYHGSC